MSRLGVVAAALLLGALFAPAAMTGPDARAPVIRYQDDQFGPILATPAKRALYFWNRERRAGGKIRCTGGCARLWPPLIVKSRAAVPRRVAGIRGTLGVIRRPDGRLQVTYNRLPVYTYVHEGPEQVRCDNVNGWFVVRLR
jgi:predicted lipoprotein with Yx(FWY)xxD motif